MKKYLLSALIIMSAPLIAACGSDTTSISGSESQEDVITADDQTAVKSKKEGATETNKVQEDDQLKVTNTFTNKELGLTGTVGPMNYNISAVQLKTIEPKTEEAASLLEAEVGDTIHAFTIEMSGENTSDEDINFHLGQATAITSTKEQLEPDIFMSEHIESEYLGEVKHEGYNVYILKNSTVDELKTIEIRVSAPLNSNFDSVGEDIKHTIEVNN